jgi:hypothetical protein
MSSLLGRRRAARQRATAPTGCTVTATRVRDTPRITDQQAYVATRLGCAMGRASRLARHGEQAALSGGSSPWASFGPTGSNPFSNFDLF